MERTRWGTISTHIDSKTREVSQSIIKNGQISGEDFKSPKKAKKALAERQAKNELYSKRLSFLGISILAVTAYGELKSLREGRGFNPRIGLIGGALWAVSHLGSDIYADRANFFAYREEEVLLAQYKLKLERKSAKKEAKKALQV